MGAIADPILDILCRLLPRATRAALESTFWYWHRSHAPEHFRRDAFGRYPSEYSPSAKADADRWRARHARDIARGYMRAAANLLRESGRLDRAFLGGSILFSGTATRLRARWPALPAYATRPDKHSGFQAARALVAVSEEERVRMTQVYRDWLSGTTPALCSNLRRQAVERCASDDMR